MNITEFAQYAGAAQAVTAHMLAKGRRNPGYIGVTLLDAAAGQQRRAQLSAPCRSLRVIGDRSSLEVFLNGGSTVFSTRYYPAPGDIALQLQGADAEIYGL